MADSQFMEKFCPDDQIHTLAGWFTTSANQCGSLQVVPAAVSVSLAWLGPTQLTSSSWCTHVQTDQTGLDRTQTASSKPVSLANTLLSDKLYFRVGSPVKLSSVAQLSSGESIWPDFLPVFSAAEARDSCRTQRENTPLPASKKRGEGLSWDLDTDLINPQPRRRVVAVVVAGA